MIIKDSTLQGLRTMVRAEFRQAFDAAVNREDYKELVTIVTSNTKSNSYAWLGSFPHMREWVGDRIVNDMKEFAYAIENKKYEATLGIDRTDIEDDNLGQYRVLAQTQGQETVDFFWREIAKLIADGFTALCYDGQNFFDTDHPVYEKADGTGSNTPTSNILGFGSENPWFLLDLNRPLKPFIMQERFAPEFDEIKDTQNETVFMKDKYLYGIRYRGNWGYGLWQQAIASKEALTADNFQKAYSMMETFKRDGGDPLGLRPTHLIVDASNRAAAEEILLKQNLLGGESNINYNRVKLIVCHWL
ncbi:Mu-like prophage major head subunit gpT family protein [Treponema vincentii]|uniref:Mu-like prophage major head subunit gpT family protein n=1 Tax=Treponema vincentii TaxID=69710 RepID=UPI0020A316D1|nr:Mu-like prophage major head subunit gpT family protein [Treponema vincentii]UTC47439.1 head protein [Treponema vincentii]UTC48349.1 head protein [Treponema vincentii]